MKKKQESWKKNNFEKKIKKEEKMEKLGKKERGEKHCGLLL